MTDEAPKKTRPFRTAYYDCHLPVFKQGDDLAHHLETEGSPADAFEALAVQYEAAAAHCRRMVGLAREVPEIEVDACTHHIGIRGPAERLGPLVEEGLLALDLYEDDVEATREAFADLVLGEFDEAGTFGPAEASGRVAGIDPDLHGLDPAWVTETLEEMVTEGSLERVGDGYRVRDPEPEE